MDLETAIMKRQSIRAFKPDPVPLETLKKIINLALRAPSWADTQPWEFIVVSGKKLKEIQEGFLNRGEGEAKSEVSRPYEFPEPYISRMRGLMSKERTFMSEEDFKGRTTRNFYHYGAPACIYLLVGKSFVYQSKGVNVWSIFDCGMAVENLMLAATGYGLGTVAQAQAVVYPDIIRKVLPVPEDKLLALGIAIGYPDMNAPRNKFRSEREPLEKMATFYGFEK
jgi:nitroreductase